MIMCIMTLFEQTWSDRQPNIEKRKQENKIFLDRIDFGHFLIATNNFSKYLFLVSFSTSLVPPNFVAMRWYQGKEETIK